LSQIEHALGEAHHALLALRRYVHDEISEKLHGAEFQTETGQLLLAAILVELRQIRSALRDITAELGRRLASSGSCTAGTSTTQAFYR